MKEQNFCTVVICAFTFFVVVCTLQIKASRMLPSDISLNDIEVLSSNETGLDCSNCNVAGGPGGASCSCTGGTVSVDTPIGGIGGGGAACEVSVFPGYSLVAIRIRKGFVDVHHVRIRNHKFNNIGK